MGKAKLIKVLKGVEDLAGTLPRVNVTNRQVNLGTGAELLEEYNKTNKIPTQDPLADEIVDLTASQEASRRLDRLNNPSADPNGFYQTLSPEEFTMRYQKQLTNPDYMARNSHPLESGVDVGEIAKSQGAHITMRNNLLHRLKKNPRWGKRVEQWVGDSAYKDEVFFHTDKWTDPLRKDSFIQFEDPFEFGLHAGTAAAANRFTGFGSVEDIMRSRDYLDSTLDEIADFGGLDAEKLKRIMAREVENYFDQRFQVEKGIHMPTDEWLKVVDKVDEQIGSEGRVQIDRLMSKLRDFPTPSTTPMIFRGKNGLLLKDLEANFRPNTIGEQLLEIFPEDADLIEAAMAATRKEKTKNLQEFIESKGFDHIVYHNSVEDKGSVSIINWNPDLQRSVYDQEFAGLSESSAAAQAFLGIIGLGGTGAALQSDE